MNEEQMRAEFEKCFPFSECDGIHDRQLRIWQAAYASRQPEIDALNAKVAMLNVRNSMMVDTAE